MTIQLIVGEYVCIIDGVIFERSVISLPARWSVWLEIILDVDWGSAGLLAHCGVCCSKVEWKCKIKEDLRRERERERDYGDLCDFVYLPGP